MSSDPRLRIPFRFHAAGHAFSGEFTKPGRHLIDTQAPATLPTIGGHSSGHVDNFHYADFVSFKSGYTHVTGRRLSDTKFVTNATTVIEDLNILDVVTADRVVCRLTSTHNPKDPEGHITAAGSSFQGLRIDGHDVTVKLRTKLLDTCKNFEDLRKHVEKGGEKGRIAGKSPRAVTCSLVDTIATDLKGVKPKQHAITVPDFGTIYLAEIHAYHGTKTLTMMRLELGCPHIANALVAEAMINGQAPPPPHG